MDYRKKNSQKPTRLDLHSFLTNPLNFQENQVANGPDWANVSRFTHFLQKIGKIWQNFKNKLSGRKLKNLLTLKTLVSDLNLGLGFQSHYLTTFNAHGVTIAWKLGEKTNLMELKKNCDNAEVWLCAEKKPY